MRGTLHRQMLVLVSVALVASAVLLSPLPARAASLVTNCTDSGSGSLRDAIATASSGATITFQSGLTCTAAGAGPILLTGGTLAIGTNLTIDATGATIAVDGNNAVTVFTVSSSVVAAISGLTIQHGFTAGNGGGINVGTFASLTVRNVTIIGNTASDGSPGIILDRGTLTVVSSTIANNSGGTLGGGIANLGGTVAVTNSTITGNSSGQAGGINNSGGTLTVTSSTLAGNTATFSGASGGILTTANCPPTCPSGVVTLTNTIVATSTGGDLAAFSGGSFTGNNNLIDDAASAGGFTDSAGGNIVGHPALLGTLGNHGGTTQTIPLLAGSLAIDTGAPVGFGPAGNPVPSTDQRGVARVNGPDIGAYEARFIVAPVGGGNQSTVAGTPFPDPLVVSVTSLIGEPVPNLAVSFVAPTSGASGTFPGNLNVVSVTTNASGIATAPAFTANAIVGGYSVTASAAGVATPASFALTNLPLVASIVASAGTPQQATVNSPFATPLAVTVTDGGGSPVGGVSVTFTAPATGASGYFAVSPVVITNSGGVATAPLFFANGIAGSYSVTANVTAAPLGTPASFALTNSVGAASSLTPGTGTTPQSAHVTTAYPTSFAVTARDAQNNPIPGRTITFTAPVIGPSGTFAGNGALVAVQTDTSGVATAPAFTANTIAGGPYSVLASDGIGHTAYFALTNTPSVPTITAVSPPSGSIDGGGTVAITGTVFLNGATVTFGGTAAINVVVLNATTITAKVPAHAAGTVDMAVRNTDGGTATLAGGYTYGVVTPLPGGRTPVTGPAADPPRPLPAARP